MQSAPTRPIDTTASGAIPGARFAYEYVTIWRVEFGNATADVPVRVRGEAISDDIVVTIHFFDGRPPETHTMRGAAPGSRAVFLPAAFAVVGD